VRESLPRWDKVRERDRKGWGSGFHGSLECERSGVVVVVKLMGGDRFLRWWEFRLYWPHGLKVHTIF
jgi:hypothetical protein